MTDSHAADVQAELQQYLNSKNINTLFIQIVESLLIEKPANPIAFIIEYLNKQYPDQAKAAMKVEVKEPVKVIAAKKKATPEHSDEEDDDDDVGDIAPVKKPTGGAKPRRVSVSAESMDPEKMKAQMSQVTKIEKSEDVFNRLQEVVGKSPLLRNLDDEQRVAIINAFSGPLVKQPGENIIVQGDIGDIFYLLEDGLVDVYVSKGGAPEMKVHTYNPGNSFGELAIMYNAPRAATCRAQTVCKLWALDRVSFKCIVVAAAMEKRAKYVGFLQQVELLSSLTENEIQTLADSLAEEKYNDGDIVCNQGDEGEFFYIIKEGAAICSQKDGQGGSIVVATLTAGNYFGEIALVNSSPRQATVKASGTLKVLALDKATFTRVMGPLDEIMKRNMDEYKKFAAKNI